MSTAPGGKLSLRDRKKAATRRALIEAAEQLFEERGFDAVTVAEIADAANVSVKTMFVYFRTKEDLVFADNELIESLVAAVRDRPAGSAPADAIVRVLSAAIDPQHVQEGLEGFHRGYGQSLALESGLLRLWADFENQLTAVLAAEAGGTATPSMRALAMQLVALVRLMTSDEMRLAVAAKAPRTAARDVRAALDAAAAAVKRAYPTEGN
ncbi:helix-turn-helix domain-containing protein [Actinoplanes sp. NPDC051411]|uniref:TetR/AcrR family transcriptional regulator n=1 Tax=Actinoplanes sp. NPDC051411 TaxID=3155522 RepID=UPI0034376D5D